MIGAKGKNGGRNSPFGKRCYAKPIEGKRRKKREIARYDKRGKDKKKKKERKKES